MPDPMRRLANAIARTWISAHPSIAIVIAFTLAVSPMFGGPTASALTGRVTSDGRPLAAVTVTVSSPSLPGVRSAVTLGNGHYHIGALPPGMYDLSFERQGLQTQLRRARLKLAETSRVDADLKPSAVEETVTLTAINPTIIETPQLSHSFDAVTIGRLAMQRGIEDRVLLAPAVQSSGPYGFPIIHGATFFDNLYLLDGAVISEDAPADAVEEAVAETVVLTGALPPEYGRLTGGVVATITKAGGNESTGSVRDNISSDGWSRRSNFGERGRARNLNHLSEATFGAGLLDDRLWFFLGVSRDDSEVSAHTTATNLFYKAGRKQQRYQARLTGDIAENHLVTGSYLSAEDERKNVAAGNIVDFRSLRDLRVPVRLFSTRYSGVLVPDLLLEARYSNNSSSIRGEGSSTRDRIFGTVLRDIDRDWRGWSPPGCGSCPPAEEDHRAWGAKGAYFFGTATTGSHLLTAGYDELRELQKGEEHPSRSDFQFFGDFFFSGEQLFIRADPARSRIEWRSFPAAHATTESDLAAFFINDEWRLDDRWSFHAGARYDDQGARVPAGQEIDIAARISPRLAVIYGSAVQRASISYGRYASKLDAPIGGGNAAIYVFRYDGPALNPLGTAVPLSNEDVLRRIVEWFIANGDADPGSPLVVSAHVPGVNMQIDGDLRSPYTDELTLALGRRFGATGYIRADLLRRSWADFYALRRDLDTGRTDEGTLDVGLIENAGGDDFRRNYDALELHGSYTSFGINLTGNYTWSRLRGNMEGRELAGLIEAGGRESWEGPAYPEYTGFAQNRPVGYLSGDVRHRANVWLQFELPAPQGELKASVLARYHSGQSFSAAAAIEPAGVSNPGYATPPTRVQYFFSDRGAFRLDDIGSTDISLTWSLPVSRASLFVKGDLVNLFNQQGLENVESPTRGSLIDKGVTILRPFNPFTETPVEGTHYALSESFGQALSPDAYQLPRTFRLALGVRF